MTEVEVRDTLVAHLNTAWVAKYPAVSLFFENTTSVSLDTVGDSFASAAIDFTDSVPQGIDELPITGSYGVVTVRLFTKEGLGTRATLGVAGFLRALLSYKRLGGVTLGVLRFGKKVARDGWASQDVVTPFSFWQ